MWLPIISGRAPHSSSIPVGESHGLCFQYFSTNLNQLNPLWHPHKWSTPLFIYGWFLYVSLMISMENISTDSTDSVVPQWTQGNAPWHLNQRAPNVRPVRATFGVFHLAKRAKGSDTDVQTVEKRCKNDKLGKKSETLMKIEENWNEHLLNFRTWHKLHRLPVNHPEIHSHFKVVLSYGFAVKRTFLRQKQPHFMQLGPLEPLDGPHLKAITPLSQKRL